MRKVADAENYTECSTETMDTPCIIADNDERSVTHHYVLNNTNVLREGDALYPNKSQWRTYC